MEAQKHAGDELPVLTLEQLVAADDREEKVVSVPEWGGSVRIKALSLGQYQDALERATVGGKVDDNKAALYTLLEGVVEPALTAEHFEMLRQKSAKSITTVMLAIAELSGVDDATVKEAEARFPQAG